MNRNLLNKTLAELRDLIDDLQQVERCLKAGDAKGACSGYFNLGSVTPHGEIHPAFANGLCSLAEQQIEEEELSGRQ